MSISGENWQFDKIYKLNVSNCRVRESINLQVMIWIKQTYWTRPSVWCQNWRRFYKVQIQSHRDSNNYTNTDLSSALTQTHTGLKLFFKNVEFKIFKMFYHQRGYRTKRACLKQCYRQFVTELTNYFISLTNTSCVIIM